MFEHLGDDVIAIESIDSLVIHLEQNIVLTKTGTIGNRIGLYVADKLPSVRFHCLEFETV